MAQSRGIRQTVIEPPPDVREAAPTRPAPPPAPTVKEPDAARPCWPLRRPPVPVLWIMDDGWQTGEVVRMRQSPLRIGRTVGDVRILHDELIADPQAEIAWVKRKLIVRALGGVSACGSPRLLQRVAKAPLGVGQVILIGGSRYQFGGAPATPGRGELMPLDVQEGNRRIPLAGDEVWIGRDPGPSGVVSTDPAVDRRHACLMREASGQWFIVDNGSLNGTWVDVPEIQVDGGVEFMLGEQVFRLEAPQREERPQP